MPAERTFRSKMDRFLRHLAKRIEYPWEQKEMENAGWRGTPTGWERNYSLALGHGKSAAEQNMVDQLNNLVKARAIDIGMRPGHVALARIPVLSGAVNGFEIDRDDLLVRIKESFAQITQVKFEAMYLYMKQFKV